MPPKTRLCRLFALVLISACAGKPPPRVVNVEPPPRPDPLASAVRQSGFVTVWRKNERLWLGIENDRLGGPFLFFLQSTRGMGEHEPQLNGGSRGKCLVAVFRRQGTQLQLRALNTHYTARPNTPEARAVRESFSDSLLATGGPIASTASSEGMAV